MLRYNDIPLPSGWKPALGIPLTDRRIAKRVREGWYGRIAQLKAHAKSQDKEKRNKAKLELQRYEGIPVKKTRVVRFRVDISEFV